MQTKMVRCSTVPGLSTLWHSWYMQFVALLVSLVLIGLVSSQHEKLLASESSGTNLSKPVQQQPRLAAALRCYPRRGCSHLTVKADITEARFLQVFLNTAVGRALKKKVKLELRVPEDVFSSQDCGHGPTWLEGWK